MAQAGRLGPKVRPLGSVLHSSREPADGRTIEIVLGIIISSSIVRLLILGRDVVIKTFKIVLSQFHIRLRISNFIA